MEKIFLNGQSYHLELCHRENSTQEKLNQLHAGLFTLLQEREREFGFSPQIITHYPDPEKDFFTNPPGYIAKLVKNTDKNTGRIIILTTYGDILGPALVGAGYEKKAVHMPAGPDNTAIFSTDCNQLPDNIHTLYIEAVNECDEKIRPGFILSLTDRAGAVCGGMSGSIWPCGNASYAWIATVAVSRDMPPGTGTLLAEQVLSYLKRQGVKKIHLGTQTAEGFYHKLGFNIDHHVVTGLRYRSGKGGETIAHNLVIMSKKP